MRKYQLSHVVIYQDGALFDAEGYETSVPVEGELLDLLKKHPSDVPAREFFEDNISGIVYDVHFIPGNDVVHVMLFDVSGVFSCEDYKEREIRNLYRDVFSSLTKGKLLLQEPHELNMGDGEKIFDMPIIEKSDISKARDMLIQGIGSSNVTKRCKYFLKLCLSEASTNVLKHAETGRASVL